jgi:hypothetical protein
MGRLPPLSEVLPKIEPFNYKPPKTDTTLDHLPTTWNLAIDGASTLKHRWE